MTTKFFDVLTQFSSADYTSSTLVGAVGICVLVIGTNIIYQIDFSCFSIFRCFGQKKGRQSK